MVMDVPRDCAGEIRACLTGTVVFLIARLDLQGEEVMERSFEVNGTDMSNRLSCLTRLRMSIDPVVRESDSEAASKSLSPEGLDHCEDSSDVNP